MKKIAIAVLAVVMLAISAVVWYRMPIDLMQLQPDDVLEIVVFDGSTGKATHIQQQAQIETIINSLNEVKLQRSKPSVGYTGFRFKITIYLNDGKEAGDWNNFIINSSTTIRKDPFFYKVIEGDAAYDYIESIIS